MHCLFNRTLFVWANSETKKRGIYAKSIFGEDALANVSLEKNMAKPESPVTGTLAWLIGCWAIGLEITV